MEIDDPFEEEMLIANETPGHPSPPASVSGAGPSGAFRAPGPRPAGGGRGGGVRAEEDMEESEDDLEGFAAFRAPRMAPRMAREDDGMSVDNEEYSASEFIDRALDDVPGWSRRIMGEGITPSPAIFACGLRGSHVKHSADLWRRGNEPLPARVEAINIPLDFLAKNAQTLADFETFTDPNACARGVALAEMLGMFTTGTSKRWLCSDTHVELAKAKAQNLEGEDLEKKRKSLDGSINTYSYLPFVNGDDLSLQNKECMMFNWVFEELYSPDPTPENPNIPPSHRVGIRIKKIIYDPAASSDALWGKTMDESDSVDRAGKANSMPESKRTDKMMKQNAFQREQTNDADMGKNACTMYKLVKNMTSLERMLQAYGGATKQHNGRPLYNDFSADLKPGCNRESLKGDPEWGGRHPLGPSVALNFNRFVEPRAGKPGVNVAIAGMVDTKGNLIEIHPEQADPRKYFDEEGRLVPPKFAQDKYFWCHDPSALNIFNIPFPRPVHGSIQPDDTLLKMYWEVYRSTEPSLIENDRLGLTTFEQNKDALLVSFDDMVQARDQCQEETVRAILGESMLERDSLNLTQPEREMLKNRRIYGRTGSDGSAERVGEGAWVIEPRQILKEQDVVNCRVHDLIQTWNKQKNKHNCEQRAKGLLSKDAFVAEDNTRLQTLQKGVRACCAIGLQHYEHSYESKDLASTIPPGYYDICHRGLREALQEAGRIGKRKARSHVCTVPRHAVLTDATWCRCRPRMAARRKARRTWRLRTARNFLPRTFRRMVSFGPG